MWGDRQALRDARKIAEDTMQPITERQQAQKRIDEVLAEMRRKRRALDATFEDSAMLRRALRFKRKFLERDGRPCNGGRLCGEGYNGSLNAQLLLHLITDEVTSFFVDDEVQRHLAGRLASYLLPVILVPIVFGVVAICWVFVVQAFAGMFSRSASGWLDQMTWKQIRRAAVGNDTDDEIAIGTAPYPTWVAVQRPFLPLAVSSEITQWSNDATFRSLAKFRNAISELAFIDRGGKEADNLLAYLNWNELIHTTYFFVPSFTRLVAFAIAQSDGFKAVGVDGDGEVAAWLNELEPGAVEALPMTEQAA